MLVVAWDMNRNLVKILEKAGARYIWQITFDPANQAVTFTGNSSQSIQFTLDELAVRPSVVSLPSPTAGPVLPYILTYAAADVWQFPVIKNGPYSFWPVSSKAQSNTFVVVVVDSDNLIQEFIECPGGSKIQDVQINDANHAIVLHGQGNSTVPFDYDTTMACYSCCYNITKDDFLFLAQYFNVPLSDAEATALATAMPQINCALCCRMQGTFTKESGPEKRSTDPVTVGFFLGGIIGAFGGFLIGGVLGIAPGWVAGTAAGIGIGQTVPPSSDLGPYKLSSLEINHSLVG